MDCFLPLAIFCWIISTFTPPTLAQQPYVGRETIKCSSKDNSTSITGYACNGHNSSCRSYLIFRSKAPYDSVPSISSLFSSEPHELSKINSVPEAATFPADKEVIVPVICSCYGHFYSANASYVIRHGDTRYAIAADLYQGLVSCRAVKIQTCCSTFIYSGMNVTIPVRCACPTINQTRDGIRYLLTYPVEPDDSVSIVSQRFGSDALMTLAANELSEFSRIFPSSTLLIPLRNPLTIDKIRIPFKASRPPPPPPHRLVSREKRTLGWWAFVVIGASASALISVLFYLFLFRQRKSTSPPPPPAAAAAAAAGDSKQPTKLEIAWFPDDIKQAVRAFEFEELKAATDDFDEEKSKISGSVYHGVIMGEEVAVKRVSRDVSLEIQMLKLVNHVNLIRLQGICSHEGQVYLVFEYAANGPLSSWIFDKDRSSVLGWVLRMQIALDVANGLAYLHSYTCPAHVHMDVRSGNVFLDGDLRAKIGNLGMARWQPAEGRVESTRHIAGTRGYLAPEFLDLGLVSPKVDVYAFGVLLLELMSGKEAVIGGGEEGHVFLSALFEDLVASRGEVGDGVVRERVRDFMDPSLGGNYPVEAAARVAELAEACLSRAVGRRPGMEDLSRELALVLAASVAWEFSRSGV